MPPVRGLSVVEGKRMRTVTGGWGVGRGCCWAGECWNKITKPMATRASRQRADRRANPCKLWTEQERQKDPCVFCASLFLPMSLYHTTQATLLFFTEHSIPHHVVTSSQAMYNNGKIPKSPCRRSYVPIRRLI
jgi:hypothetical protein